MEYVRYVTPRKSWRFYYLLLRILEPWYAR